MKENAWLSRNVVQGTERGKIIQPPKLTPPWPVGSRFSGKLRPHGSLVPSFPPPQHPPHGSRPFHFVPKARSPGHLWLATPTATLFPLPCALLRGTQETFPDRRTHSLRRPVEGRSAPWLVGFSDFPGLSNPKLLLLDPTSFMTVRVAAKTPQRFPA